MQRLKQLLDRAEPVKWLFYGDSITHGALHTWGARDYTQHFAERIRFELQRNRDVVINTAVSGDTTRELLEDFSWRVEQFQPDVVFVMIGMNDCALNRALDEVTFKANLHELCQRIESWRGIPVLQTTCPILPGTAPEREPAFPAYMQHIRSVAAERQLPLIDHESYWRGHTEKHFYWMNNGFHPNGHGHTVFAHLLFRSIGIFDPNPDNSPVCRLFVP